MGSCVKPRFNIREGSGRSLRVFARHNNNPWKMSSTTLQRRSQEFLERAQRSEQYARETSDDYARKEFLVSARKWRELAQTAQEYIGRGYDADL